MSKGPILFDDAPKTRAKTRKVKAKILDSDPQQEAAEGAQTPATAPPVPDPGVDPSLNGQAMQTLASLAGRKGSGLAKFFWTTLVSLIGFAVSVAAWNFVTGLLASNPVLGLIAAGLFAAFALAVLLVVCKELLALARLQRMDKLRKHSDQALAGGDLKAAKEVARKVSKLYSNRPDLAEGRATLDKRLEEAFDADAVLGQVEHRLLAPLDRAAEQQVEAAARQVATVTAIVPLALADLLAALTSNLRMIRQIADIYGGRAGTIGSWRLTRTVFLHLIATGAVAVGDDLISSIAGGGLLSKISRRFGEGLINGALTARVGVAAIEVCRPLAFAQLDRPSVSGIVARGLSGMIPTAKGE